MLNKIIKWGVISGIIMVANFYISYLIFPLVDAAAYTNSEIMGYVGIIVGSLIIYLAIADYFQADRAHIGLWPRVKLGLGVAFIAGVIVGLYNIIYVEFIDPTFMQGYLEFSISQLPVQSGAEFDKHVAELTEAMKSFDGIAVNFFLMASIVWMMGIPISIISALLHKRLAR